MHNRQSTDYPSFKMPTTLKWIKKFQITMATTKKEKIVATSYQVFPINVDLKSTYDVKKKHYNIFIIYSTAIIFLRRWMYNADTL